jgi:hypothetical protein
MMDKLIPAAEYISTCCKFAHKCVAVLVLVAGKFDAERKIVQGNIGHEVPTSKE